jgi:hypothetical protein
MPIRATSAKPITVPIRPCHELKSRYRRGASQAYLRRPAYTMGPPRVPGFMLRGEMWRTRQDSNL